MTASLTRKSLIESLLGWLDAKKPHEVSDALGIIGDHLLSVCQLSQSEARIIIDLYQAVLDARETERIEAALEALVSEIFKQGVGEMIAEFIHE